MEHQVKDILEAIQVTLLLEEMITTLVVVVEPVVEELVVLTTLDLMALEQMVGLG
jgi:hypothetical protein